jgi:hypothetical protein
MKIWRQGTVVALPRGILIAIALNLLPVSTPWVDPPKASSPASLSIADVRSTYDQLPLSFEANQGQTDHQVKFLSRGQGYNLFLTSTEAVLVLTSLERPSEVEDSRSSKETRQSVLRMGLIGANPALTISGFNALPGKVNYFIGNDPYHWRTKVPTYVKVQYKDVYPGIDLVFYGNQRQLEYDFIVAPGADPTAISLSFSGEDQLVLDRQGDLILHFGDSELRLQKPLIYQLVNGSKQQIPGNYRLHGHHQISFQVAAYDRTNPLVIDPTLSYSTYLGGSSSDQGVSIAVDAAGNAFVTGITQSLNFPTVSGGFQMTLAGPQDAFVTKLNPTGSGLVYSTYLGGSGDDFGLGIALDSSTNAYVTGGTASTDFPTAGAFQPALAGSPDAFVTKLDSTGSALLYSTYLGGSGQDRGSQIALDSAGNAYVAGFTVSTNFPTTVGAFDTTFNGGGDAFVTKLNPTGSGLTYSTYLGGSVGLNATDSAQGIAVDAAGNAYVTGTAESTNFPTTAGAFQTTHAGSTDAFVTKLNPTGSGLIYSTYLGGNGFDQGFGIAIDSIANAYVSGGTSSSNFPTTPGVFQPGYAGGNRDVFMTKLNPTGSGLVYSTYLGGSGDDFGLGIALDSSTNAYVTGGTASTNFPTAGAFQPALGGSFDAFVTKLNATASGVTYSTYLGGSSIEATGAARIALDPFSNAYVTSSTASTNFPTTAGAFQTTLAGGDDAFVSKLIDIALPPATTGKVTGGGSVNVSGGVSNFGFIVQRKDAADPIKGSFNYHNKASGAKIKDSSFTSLAISGNMALFEGTCTNNGASCTFRVTVTDNGEPGDADEFTISISGGAEEGGPMRSGNIQIH